VSRGCKKSDWSGGEAAPVPVGTEIGEPLELSAVAGELDCRPEELEPLGVGYPTLCKAGGVS
jgi:hypothetical protein